MADTAVRRTSIGWPSLTACRTSTISSGMGRHWVRQAEKSSKRRTNTRRVPRSRRRLRLVWILASVAVAAYLYYRPLASYFETKSDLATMRAEQIGGREGPPG